MTGPQFTQPIQIPQLAELERQRIALQKELNKTCDILKMDESESEGLGEIM
jgi:ABC-type iron transport system FetAB ATPase subunit